MNTQITKFNEALVGLETQKKTLQKEFNKHSKQFTKIITNQEIPLKERWDFWISSPSDLKESPDYYPDGILGEYVQWRCDAPEVYGRGKLVYWSDILDDVWDWNSDEFNTDFEGWDADRLTQVLEAVLSANEEAFKYDW